MNDGFKQRLVGAVVLSCLALILWPLVFSSSGQPGVDQRTQIPVRPKVEKYVVAKPSRPTMPAPIAKSVEQVKKVSQQSQVSSNKREQPILNDSGLPQSWSLQLGSFSEQKNADELKQALQKKGYKAYTRSVKTTEGKATRVYIGPRLTKSNFDKDKAAIEKAFKLSTIVVHFER
jgi:DedD protein